MEILEKASGGPLTFQSLLHSIRTSDEVTQAELARKVGISRAKICDYEKGRRTPTLKIAAKMAKVLGYPESLFIAKIIEDQIRNAQLNIKIKVEAA